MAEGGPLPHLIDGLDHTSAELIYDPANTTDAYGLLTILTKGLTANNLYK